VDEEQAEVDEGQAEVDEGQVEVDEAQVEVDEEQVALEPWQEWGKETEVRDSPSPCPHHPRAGQWPGDGGEAEDGTNVCTLIFSEAVLSLALFCSMTAASICTTAAGPARTSQRITSYDSP